MSNKLSIILRACDEARMNGIEISVVRDRFAEYETDRYGYAPTFAVKTLYRGGTVIGIAHSDGSYTERD